MIHPYSHYPARAARRWSDEVALIDGRRQCTWLELDRRSRQIALVLVERGLQPGDRVAIDQYNCIEYVESVVAIAHAGGVIVPLLGALTEPEHRYIVDNAGASFIIVLDPARIERAGSVANQDTQLLVFGGDDPGINLDRLAESKDPATEESLGIDLPPSTVAQILYTSGTTGKPKGVTHSYAGVAAGMIFWSTQFNLTANDRVLGQLPLSHFGGRAMDSCWIAGAKLVILSDASPPCILDAIHRHRVSMILVVPTLLRMLLDHSDAPKSDLSSLRAVVYAASPASESLVTRALERLGPVLYTGFGQTEAYGLNTIMGPEEHRMADNKRLTSVGRESHWAQVRIRSDDDKDLLPGEIGEIQVSAPWITSGFWQRPDLDRERLHNGWLRTGDLGRQDADGYFYLADRREDMIITGGYNVYPAEVENILENHEAVAECGVFAIPDDKWGEAVHAAVLLRQGEQVPGDELIAFCKQHLANFKVPKGIDIVDELPRTPVGKILRRELREPWWRDHGRKVHGAQ